MEDGLLQITGNQFITTSLPYRDFSIRHNRSRSVMPFGQNGLSAWNKYARPNENAGDYGQRSAVLAYHAHRAVKRNLRAIGKRKAATRLVFIHYRNFKAGTTFSPIRVSYRYVPI